jgi:hypothetical protein
MPALCPATTLAPIAVEILLCRGSAQKIASPVRWRSGGTNSGKKLQKNIKTKKTTAII